MKNKKLSEEEFLMLADVDICIYDGFQDFADLSKMHGVMKTTKLKLLVQENYVRCRYSNESPSRLYFDLTKKGVDCLEKLANK